MPVPAVFSVSLLAALFHLPDVPGEAAAVLGGRLEAGTVRDGPIVTDR